ncbi:MAG: hypothetical protein JXB46_10395 [Candidatus Eisenbacteria bacterium]|nr:hypothetical protein [Candidatus Eisenbacteria bacterium]
MTTREQLCEQIKQLPDDVVEQIADFASFVMARRQAKPGYVDWNSQEWQDFALGQLLRDDDEVEYSLKDARRVFTS